MLNNTLSKQICESAGIKPKWKARHYIGGQFDNVPTYSYDSFDTLERAELFHTADSDDNSGLNFMFKNDRPIKVNVDFENNNNNFVKLLELLYSAGISVSFCGKLETLKHVKDLFEWRFFIKCQTESKKGDIDKYLCISKFTKALQKQEWEF